MNELFLTYCNSTAFSTSFPTIFPTVVKGSIKITIILKLRRAEGLNLKTIRQFINVSIRPYKRQKSMLHFTALRGVRAHENVEHSQRRENVIYKDRSRVHVVEPLLQLENTQYIMLNNVETQHRHMFS